MGRWRQVRWRDGEDFEQFESGGGKPGFGALLFFQQAACKGGDQLHEQGGEGAHRHRFITDGGSAWEPGGENKDVLEQKIVNLTKLSGETHEGGRGVHCCQSEGRFDAPQVCHH